MARTVKRADLNREMASFLLALWSIEVSVQKLINHNCQGRRPGTFYKEKRPKLAEARFFAVRGIGQKANK